MRTTLDIDTDLFRRAKRLAADRGTTLTAIVETALREVLRPRSTSGREFRLRLRTKKTGLLPGVDIADRDALYERMEGRA
jgi:hypothetical protein